MANSVFKTITKMGYEQVSSENERTTFRKKQKGCVFTVIFNAKENYINGILIPVSSVTERRDLVYLYAGWKNLIIDMKYLSNLTGYSIINNIEEDE